MHNLIKQNDEVFYLKKNINYFTNNDILFLKQQAKLNKSQKCRICVHKDKNELLHEMFIVHTNLCYVRPHFHIDKSESIHVLEGEADLFIFNNKGSINSKINLGDIATKKNYFYKINKEIIHSLIIKTKFFVFKETTTGPFKKNMMNYPDWSPKNFDKKFNNDLISFRQ